MNQGTKKIPAGCFEAELAEVIYHEYEAMDEILGYILKTMDENTLLVVASDHGFATSGSTGGHHLYGVLLMKGAQIRKGVEITGAGVEDIVPTLLYAAGYPVGVDMDGKVLFSAFEYDYVKEHPLQVIETYETDGFKPAARPSSATHDEEYIDRLEGIGYLQ